jgi:sec-independent protein translocase protein TatA
MNVFGIGLPEMAVIAAIALLVFGPKRLPELGRSLGRTLKGFQSASSEFEREFRSALSTAEGSDLPESGVVGGSPVTESARPAESASLAESAPLAESGTGGPGDGAGGSGGSGDASAG